MRSFIEENDSVTSIPRYIVERDSVQVQTAFRGIVKIVKDLGIIRITLVVPKKGGWENTIVAKFTATLRSNFDQGLLVGAHISIKDMAKLDDAWGAQAIMFLPWIDSEAHEWKATWRPETIGPKAEETQASTLSEPVEEALKRLRGMINLSTGLGHPLDKKHAERTFDKLCSEGQSFDPAEIRRWAQRNNWSSSAAADLEAVARKRG